MSRGSGATMGTWEGLGGSGVRVLRLGALATVAFAAMGAVAAEEPYWPKPMREVAAGFQGTRGYVAQLGDSITYSMAFWAPVGWADPTPFIPDDGLPKAPKGQRWRDLIQGVRAKGPDHGNYSGWRVGNVLKVLDQVLASDKPQVAIIMLGTNDISGNKVPDGYGPGLEQIVEKCLAAHCVPILNTIPPRRGHTEAVEKANAIVKQIAQRHKVPLVDYCAAILRLQPGDAWDGTLISKDGVHPTAGKTQDYSEANLKISGYALRTWLNFLMVRDLHFRVLGGQ